MASDGLDTPYGQFAGDFLADDLANLCDPTSGIQTGPFGSQLHQKDYVPVGTPIITVEHLGENRILHRDLPRVSDADRDRLSRYLLREGDIVFSRVGSVDRRALVRQEEDGWMFSGRCLRVRPNPGKIDSSYLSYFFGHPTFKEHIRAIAVGATMPSLNTSLLSSVIVPHPPDLDEQRAIAHILGTLDDKIELNRRRNQTLEAMARALFKDWFVDFGPVRAKMEGREPYLPPDLWQLFPDRLDDEGKPEGWKMVPASELIEFNPTEALRRATPAPYLDMASLPTSGSWPDVPILREFGSGMRFRNGDTLLARITPCLENGKTAFVQCLPNETVGWGSTEYIVMRPKAPVPPAYGYLLARDGAFRDHAIRSMTGTSGRQRAQGDSVAAFKVASPSDAKLWETFGHQITPLFQSIKANAEVSVNLAGLRDTLLPRLISGELRIKNVERFMENINEGTE
ncbi:MAG: restriction endonuclease subunit S [Chromatiales bacterium]|nr:restriction endonuclease subunit S [Chromatiales bacterium]